MRRARRDFCLAALAALGGCGGGGGDGSTTAGGGTRSGSSIASSSTGTTYALNIYLPPASAGDRATLPVVYALDGESWFDTLVTIVESTRAGVIIVGVTTQGMRNRDYVPLNTCTSGGGGEQAYLNFLRGELVPFVERTIGGAPTKRMLIGHSHGGSFVYYALFAEAAAQHTFAAYAASDGSIWCEPTTADMWEVGYAQGQSDLPVRLHVSYNGFPNANADYAARIGSRSYAHLALRAQSFSGGHTGIIPAAFADALAFCLA